MVVWGNVNGIDGWIEGGNTKLAPTNISEYIKVVRISDSKTYTGISSWVLIESLTDNASSIFVLILGGAGRFMFII